MISNPNPNQSKLNDFKSKRKRKRTRNCKRNEIQGFHNMFSGREYKPVRLRI